jgi:signal transduction histidine kinase
MFNWFKKNINKVEMVPASSCVRPDDLAYNFVYVVAHQLKTPLTALKWSLELLDHDEIQNELDRKKLYLKMHEATVHAVHLVDDMMNAYKLESGKMPFDFEENPNPIDLINRTILEVRPLMDRKKLSLETKLVQGSFGTLFIDPDKFQDVIQNLLDNAIRYTQVAGKIFISCEPKADGIIVEVRDNGIGIPEEAKPKIFEKFYRSPKAVEMVNNGTGLGLFMAREIVNGHGGKIWFTSTEGKGTSFFVALPYKKK